jgi:predicted phage tail protein
MKKNRRHYPRYVTHSYIQAAMMEQSRQRAKKHLTPFAWLSMSFAVALMLVGVIAFAQMLMPVRSEAAVAKADAVKSEMQFASSGSNSVSVAAATVR